MSVRHQEFCDLVERLGADLSEADRVLLEDYAQPPEGVSLEDQLDSWTRERVEEVTGSANVDTPGRAAMALLAIYPA